MHKLVCLCVCVHVNVHTDHRCESTIWRARVCVCVCGWVGARARCMYVWCAFVFGHARMYVYVCMHACVRAPVCMHVCACTRV